MTGCLDECGSEDIEIFLVLYDKGLERMSNAEVNPSVEEAEIQSHLLKIFDKAGERADGFGIPHA